MALDTASKRISSVGLFGRILALPLPDATLGQGDRQHIAWTYSGILAGATVALEFILDMNTRIKTFLTSQYSADPATADATSLTRRYLDTAAGDATAAFRQLIDDATP